MKLCCSLAPATMAEALQSIKNVRKQADLIELRIDGLPDADLPRLLQQPRPPLIITNRVAEEGGKFSGTRAEQISLLSEAVRLGAEYVDIEYSAGTRTISKLLANSKKSKVIVSYHNFEETPNNLVSLYRKLKSTSAPILKIATMARDIVDSKRMFDLLELARAERQQLIALCMGERGQLTRILQGKYGGYLTYAPPAQESATAPGQYSLTDLIKIFRVPILGRKTKVFGLIGNPVSHSKGIYFHNQIFSRKGVDAVYVNFLVDNLSQFLNTFGTFAEAFSVTMPFKQAILPLLDSVEEGISELQAVNTVIRKKNRLIGMNIDLLAILACLKKRTSLRCKHVTVLGTGGTARTMAYAATRQGARVTIIGRDQAKAQLLASAFGCAWALPGQLAECKTDIILNATSVGMNSSTEIPFSVDRMLNARMIVFDAVYTPPQTPLLLAAERAGCTTISGLELFRTQAKLQSKIFLSVL